MKDDMNSVLDKSIFFLFSRLYLVKINKQRLKRHPDALWWFSLLMVSSHVMCLYGNISKTHLLNRVAAFAACTVLYAALYVLILLDELDLCTELPVSHVASFARHMHESIRKNTSCLYSFGPYSFVKKHAADDERRKVFGPKWIFFKFLVSTLTKWALMVSFYHVLDRATLPPSYTAMTELFKDPMKWERALWS